MHHFAWEPPVHTKRTRRRVPRPPATSPDESAEAASRPGLRGVRGVLGSLGHILGTASQPTSTMLPETLNVSGCVASRQSHAPALLPRKSLFLAVRAVPSAPSTQIAASPLSLMRLLHSTANPRITNTPQKACRAMWQPVARICPSDNFTPEPLQNLENQCNIRGVRRSCEPMVQQHCTHAL